MNNWKNIDESLVWHPFSSLESNKDNLLVKSAKGAKIYLEDGQELIDAICSWWVTIHGHSNEEINKALADQAAKVEHVIFAGFTHEPALQLAQQLTQHFGLGLKRVFFSDDGSTAVEVAVKLAIQYWHNKGIKKQKIIALEGAYHGDTFGSMSLAGKHTFFSPFNDYLFDIIQLPFPHDGKEGDTLNAMASALSSDDIAAFIYEPLIQGSAGMRIYEADLLESLVSMAQEKEVVCIADEVMTGFYRTGKLLASHHLEAQPDLVAVSKGITAGYLPLGLTLANQRIESAFLDSDKQKTFYHGHSYTGNPLSCAVAVKSLEMLLRDETQDRIRTINTAHLAQVAKLNTLKAVRKLKVLGTILSIEVETGGTSSYFSSIRDSLYQAFLKKGVLLRPLGNVVYVLPPYIISDDELEKIYESIYDVLSEL